MAPAAVGEQAAGALVATARSARSVGARTPSAATIPSSRKTGTAMVTVPEKTSPSLAGDPVARRPTAGAPDLARADRGPVERLVLRPRRARRPAARATGAGVERQRRPRPRSSTRRAWCDWHLVRGTTAVEPDPSRDRPRSRRSPRRACAGSGSATRMSSSLVTVAPARDAQPRPEAIARLQPLDEPEFGQRPQIAIDRRERRVQQPAQLVGPDLAAVGDGQEHPQPARERGVLGGFFGRSVDGAVVTGSLRRRRGATVPQRVRRHGSATPVGDTARGEDHRHPAAATERAARSAVPGGLGPEATHDVRRHASSASRPTRAWSASGRATRWTGSRRSSTCSSARTRWRSPGMSASSRRSTSTPGATGRSRSALWDIAGQVAGHAGRRPCSAARWTASRPTRRAGCCCRRRSAPNPRCGCARRASGR